MRKVYLASDHAGPELKQQLIEEISQRLPEELRGSFSFEDLGPNSTAAVDYPDYAERVGRAVQEAPKDSFGILICGSGIGMSISANKMKGIRAALCHNVEYAKLARQHNHANVLCLGARFLKTDEAVEIVKTFLQTLPSTELRHMNRVEKGDSLC